MTDPASGEGWYPANQRYLMAAVAMVRAVVEHHMEPAGADRFDECRRELDAAAAALPSPPALETLRTRLDLSDFEVDVVLMCAAVELDGGFSALCAKAQGDRDRAYPTFSLALAALPGAGWEALSPGAALRRWYLIELGPGTAITTAQLRLDEPILHYLTGAESPDERLAGLAEPVASAGELVASHRGPVEELVNVWQRTAGTAEFPTVQLCGREAYGRREVAAAVCDRLGLALCRVLAEALPTVPAELDKLIRLWSRETLLGSRALLLDCDQLEAGDTARSAAVRRVIESYDGPLILSTRKRRPPGERPLLTLDVGKPKRSEQRQLWQGLLGDAASGLDGRLDDLVAQFDLGAPSIRAAYAGAQGTVEAGVDGTEKIGDALWGSCRDQARPQLDDLAQRIRRLATWDQLVLPEDCRRMLREIVGQVSLQGLVYDSWGFRARSSRGLGVSAVFAGASGTGKTMAAEVLAGDLDLDLYRIDLASIVSKYIGETEKNLSRVFDAAEEGGTILLFDEADALFGKRSEIKDSHDRYANVEVSYLLQRMESYRGLAILTTNMRDALDQAFLRRLRFIVDFPFPSRGERAEIWRRIFPADTPTRDLDIEKLARLNVAGGSIRNIAIAGAFLAAEEQRPVGMADLLHAARHEFEKLRRPIPESEVLAEVVT